MSLQTVVKTRRSLSRSTTVVYVPLSYPSNKELKRISHQDNNRRKYRCDMCSIAYTKVALAFLKTTRNFIQQLHFSALRQTLMDVINLSPCTLSNPYFHLSRIEIVKYYTDHITDCINMNKEWTLNTIVSVSLSHILYCICHKTE